MCVFDGTFAVTSHLYSTLSPPRWSKQTTTEWMNDWTDGWNDASRLPLLYVMFNLDLKMTYLISLGYGNLKMCWILRVSYSLQLVCMLCPKWVNGLNYVEILKLQRTKQTKVNKLKIMDELPGTTNLKAIYWILVRQKVFLFPK